MSLIACPPLLLFPIRHGRSHLSLFHMACDNVDPWSTRRRLYTTRWYHVGASAGSGRQQHLPRDGNAAHDAVRRATMQAATMQAAAMQAAAVHTAAVQAATMQAAAV